MFLLLQKSNSIREKFNVFLGPFAAYALVGQGTCKLSRHLLLVLVVFVVLLRTLVCVARLLHFFNFHFKQC